MEALLAVVGVAALVFVIIPFARSLLLAGSAARGATVAFSRDELQAAFQRRRFDVVKYSAVIEAMAESLAERGTTRVEVSSWADLYANVAFKARFGEISEGTPEHEIWTAVEARLLTATASQIGPDAGPRAPR